MIRFFVPGRPYPGGSKVSGVAHRKASDGSYEPVRKPDGRLKTFTKDSSGENGINWRRDVRAAAAQAMAGARPMDGPLALTITFVMARPKGHYGTGRNAGRLKSSAPRWPTTQPDTTKLLRSTEDAMIGIVFVDDSQIVRMPLIEKVFSEDGRMGAMIVVSKLSEDVPLASKETLVGVAS